MGLLNGTSLEPAVRAKISALLREFESVVDGAATIPWFSEAWLEADNLSFPDWILLDSWYRSRCLELPLSGEAMVPVLDMANHSVNANCHYQQDENHDVKLMLRPGVEVEKGTELTISYGSDKSAAEMLFSYGFIDESHVKHSLVISMSPSPDDPLARAKLMAYGKPPHLRITKEDGNLSWSCPFSFLLAVNEEDGVQFKTLLETSGRSGGLRVFWQGEDVTERAQDFESLVGEHPMKDVFWLRAISLQRDRLQQQIQRLYESEEHSVKTDISSFEPQVKRIWESASTLRSIEVDLYEEAYQDLEKEVGRIITLILGSC
jgi:hypothetical protein